MLRQVSGSIMVAALMAAPVTTMGQLSDLERKALNERATSQYFGDPLEDPDVRAIFVLTSYSKTDFFIDDEGRHRGFGYDLLKGYEKFLNRGIKKASQRFVLIFIPMRFDDILPALADGRGDIGAAGFTITEERLQKVDFAKPYIPNVDEIVVTHGDGPRVESLHDLVGRTITVLAASSYAGHLKELNERFARQGREPMEVLEADPELGQPDILELVNSGAMDLTVVDGHIASVWQPIFPNLVLKPNVAVSSGGRIAWAVRKGTPTLKASVDDYVKTIKKGTLKGNIAFKSYYESRRWVRNPLDPNELAKLEKVVEHMQRYGERYSWDWIAIAAQAYQESHLDQSKVSPAGAVGIMQLLPSTAAQKPIKIKDVTTVENNIHAGVKYLTFLRKHYFSDPAIAPGARVDFSWAAYNAGPTRIQKLRKRAAKRGYDPNKWFYNVEHMASESIGRETVDYVANVNKYYIVYKFALERQARRLELRRKRTEQAELAKHEKALRAWRNSYSRYRQ
jgi:membrane-bound lytic murein transglycosylase MltF